MFWILESHKIWKGILEAQHKLPVLLSKAFKHTQKTNLIYKSIFISSKGQLILKHQFIIIIFKNPGSFRSEEREKHSLILLYAILKLWGKWGKMRNNSPLATSPGFLPKSRKEGSNGCKPGNMARMQDRTFSINHILAPTQNNQRKLQTSTVTQKANCDPLVNMVWFHSLYLIGHPNPIIFYNLHHPQYLYTFNNADHCFFLMHFLHLTNLLIVSCSSSHYSKYSFLFSSSLALLGF